MFDKRAHLGGSLRKRVAGLIELVGVKIIVYQAENGAHSVGHRSPIRKPGIGPESPRVRGHEAYQGIVNIRAQTYQFGGAVAVASEGIGEGAGAVMNDGGAESCGDGVLALDPSDALGQ